MTVISFSAARARRKGRPAPDPRDELLALKVRRIIRECKGLADLDEAVEGLERTNAAAVIYGETT